MYESSEILREFFKLDSVQMTATNSASSPCTLGDNRLCPGSGTSAECDQVYVNKHYDVEVFASRGSDASRSVLSRIRNILITALEEHDKFPKYILYVIEEDLMRCINFNKPGITEIYGNILKWLTGQVHDIVLKRKNDLPLRAKKYLYPQIFWVDLPHHSILNNIQRLKFNQCLESVVAVYNEMKVLHIRRHWSYDDLSLVSGGSFTFTGKTAFWKGVDEAIQFWETGRKKPIGNHSTTSNDFIKKIKMEHTSREQQYSSYNKKQHFKWPRNTKFGHKALPRPPPEREY